ncbi:GAF domain-containing protein [Thiospirillum jenense]|uniref:GAF domain-containing protein n=1 Tax=Thiospirillum jenense TaxID=1653858 RepID=A0A839HDH4_9GAMM|nr:GAF domain-containing protein [Thiospirillum jenense]MBB1126180.1 GAF domain-containing protein [Thiospirillum jenense]
MSGWSEQPVTIESLQPAQLHDLLRQMLQQFTTTLDLQVVSTALLRALLHLTASSYGTFGEVLHTEDGILYFKPIVMLQAELPDRERSKHDAAQQWNALLDSLCCVFDDVLHTGQLVITAHLQQYLQSGTLLKQPLALCPQPTTHVAPLNAVALPIYHDTTLVGIMSLVGRTDGYTTSLTDLLTPFINTYAAILENARLRDLQQYVIDDLQRTKETLAFVHQEQTALVIDELHELHTSLTAVLKAVNELETQVELPFAGYEPIKTIHQESAHVMTLIKHLVTHLCTKGIKHLDT